MTLAFRVEIAPPAGDPNWWNGSVAGRIYLAEFWGLPAPEVTPVDAVASMVVEAVVTGTASLASNAAAANGIAAEGAGAAAIQAVSVGAGAVTAGVVSAASAGLSGAAAMAVSATAEALAGAGSVGAASGALAVDVAGVAGAETGALASADLVAIMAANAAIVIDSGLGADAIAALDALAEIEATATGSAELDVVGVGSAVTATSSARPYLEVDRLWPPMIAARAAWPAPNFADTLWSRDCPVPGQWPAAVAVAAAWTHPTVSRLWSL